MSNLEFSRTYNIINKMGQTFCINFIFIYLSSDINSIIQIFRQRNCGPECIISNLKLICEH